MARLSIATDTGLTLVAAEVTTDWQEYVEVPDAVWREYQRARHVLDELERALSAYNRPENVVRPLDEYGS